MHKFITNYQVITFVVLKILSLSLSGPPHVIESYPSFFLDMMYTESCHLSAITFDNTEHNSEVLL
jgi:hypothetical protein